MTTDGARTMKTSAILGTFSGFHRFFFRGSMKTWNGTCFYVRLKGATKVVINLCPCHLLHCRCRFLIASCCRCCKKRQTYMLRLAGLPVSERGSYVNFALDNRFTADPWKWKWARFRKALVAGKRLSSRLSQIQRNDHVNQDSKSGVKAGTRVIRAPILSGQHLRAEESNRLNRQSVNMARARAIIVCARLHVKYAPNLVFWINLLETAFLSEGFLNRVFFKMKITSLLFSFDVILHCRVLWYTHHHRLQVLF